MSLSHHINPEEIVQRLQRAHLSSSGRSHRSHADTDHLNAYTSPYTSQSQIPKYRLPDYGAPSDTVYQMLRDELDLDGRPNLNLASFVSTYMEKNAEQLMVDNMAKNFADSDEYPALMQIHQRCVSIIAHLWGVRANEKAAGTATTGSSEAIHLGGLAMKRRWFERRKAEGKDTGSPNIIMGANAQVALEKFARYFDVEARILPVSKESHYVLDPKLVRASVDENTIGVFVILGSTYTGHYEDVGEISRVLDAYQEETGYDVPIHVDAASGGFVAPFTHAGAGFDGEGKRKKWNFELERVKSINASGHKYGLVYPGLGWIIWRDRSYLPDYLVFELHYLGGTEESYTLNFSRPGSQVVVQYYNLIHLGFWGYREIMENCLANARLLSDALEGTGWFVCVSDVHRKAAIAPVCGEEVEIDGEGGKMETANSNGESSVGYVPGLPAVAFRLSDTFKQEFPHVKQATVSLLLRARGWIIPNYPLPRGEDGQEILRIVIRESMSFDLADRLISDVCGVVGLLVESDEVDLSILGRVRGRGVEMKEGEKKDGDKKGEGGSGGGKDDSKATVGEDAKTKGKEEEGEGDKAREKGTEGKGTEGGDGGSTHRAVC